MMFGSGRAPLLAIDRERVPPLLSGDGGGGDSGDSSGDKRL